jgi:hypothetical protein
MAITKKPKTKAAAPTVDVEALIRKGGSVAGDGGKPKSASVVLRLPAELAERIGRAVQARKVKTPRHTWLLEAVLEKLERESI